MWTSKQEELAEPEMLAAIRAGDERAARQFFRTYHPVVARIVRTRLPVTLTEEDLCQMVFLKVFSRLDQYSGRAPLEHWISRIAVNTCLGEIKKARHRREILEGDLEQGDHSPWLAQADTSARAPLDRQEAREIVEKLLDHLAPMDRIVVSLLYMDECSVAETSALTGLTRPGVKVRAYRARKKLNKILHQIAPNLL